jgi:hypothetical protein
LSSEAVPVSVATRIKASMAACAAAEAGRLRLPEKDLPKVQCNPTDELLDFAEKYHISLDWLLCGDLKGLHGMMGKACAGVSTVERIVERIMEKYGQLSPDQQRIVTEEVNRMLAERAVEGPEGA